jgi:hypothetical protein
MAKHISTLDATAALFGGDWEDEAAGCAVRDGRFTVTDATKHLESIRQENAKADAAGAESLRRAIAQADDR